MLLEDSPFLVRTSSAPPAPTCTSACDCPGACGGGGALAGGHGGGCTPSCPGASASDICSGYVIGGGDDGCGGTCPVVTGTNPNSCSSGQCLCTPP